MSRSPGDALKVGLVSAICAWVAPYEHGKIVQMPDELVRRRLAEIWRGMILRFYREAAGERHFRILHPAAGRNRPSP